ncbi:MAG: hypothetical protein HIU90_11595 [Proteobacteria bacterium]|uniref:hypothetical protein n=1 Tax=Acidiphilium sp. PA TaxID=2871705 RepID=UPI002243A094|nr:hypothetical protein [Acidiphilium sp. PA]MBW4036107.1 hypothetical protein [Pseudomonadota bacterium]MCW8309146.1 hypothetical protein [Acidiphilium sp. PA]
MTESPEMPLPAHLGPLAVDIPRTWTPEQALAVYELITDLRDAIWLLYGCQLMDEQRSQCAGPAPDTIGDASDQAEF